WIITLYDVWAMTSTVALTKNVASWTPVDHEPVPPEVAHWFGEADAKSRKLIRNERFPIAMSRFGQEQLSKVGIEARYAPHGIDTTVFKPSASEVRKAMRIPDDAFLVMINAANKGGFPVRKAWSEMLTAFTVFAETHPDAHLYLHTNIESMAGSPPLDTMLRALASPPDRVHVVDQYEYLSGMVPNEGLAQIYSAADVLLATSMGEGFGIPVIEAQA